MFNKIDTGLTNFFFKPLNHFNIYKYFQYLGPNKETQYLNIRDFEKLLIYKNDRYKRYALLHSKKI